MYSYSTRTRTEYKINQFVVDNVEYYGKYL